MKKVLQLPSTWLHRTLLQLACLCQALHLVSLETPRRNHTRLSQPQCRPTSVTMFAQRTQRFTAHFKVIVVSVSTRYVRSSVDQRESACTTCPGNSSQSCGGENVYSFHLNFLWLTPVEAPQCDGLPEPKVSNMLRSTAICFDYQNKLKLS